MSSDFKTRFKELRKEFGYNQDELATKLSINRTSISHYEQGRSIPDIEMISVMADIFDVSADYLLGRSDIRNPYQPKVLAAHSDADEFSQADLDDIERVLEIIRKKKGQGI